MKKNVFLLAMLAIVLAFSMAVVGCSNPAGGGSGNSGGGGANPFVGTWEMSNEYGSGTITFNANMSFVATSNGESQTGTYTVSGNTAVITITSGDYAGMKQGAVISGNSLYSCRVFTKKSGNGTSANPLAGTTWEYYEEWRIETSTTTLTFNADMSFVNTYEFYGETTYTGTYTVSGNTVIIQGTDEDGTWESTYILSGDTLFVGITWNYPYTKK